jgi:hypothetical protein
MNRSQRQLTFSKTFRKTAACPASATLLSFRAEKLSPMVGTLVSQHLESCEFCRAELPLLAHHRTERASAATPEIPMNLRILAESILGEHEPRSYKKTRI